MRDIRAPFLFTTLLLLCAALSGGCERGSPSDDAGLNADADAAIGDADVSDADDSSDGDAEGDAAPDADESDGDIDAAPAEEWEFRLWAPGVDSVAVEVDVDEWTPHSLESDGDGWWTTTLELAGEGARYHFVIERGEQRFTRFDPRSLELSPGWNDSILHRRSFEWAPSEAEFRRPALDEAVIYELHVGSFTTDESGHGTFASAMERLDHIASLGVNVIELMPVVEFYGDSAWGYSPAFLFAIERAYGEPADLQRFVEAAHARGIAVVMDLVVNHLSSGTPLCDFLASNGDCGEPWFYADERGRTDWGPRPNFGSEAVREHILEAVEMWLSTFHLDGFRWDSTSNIRYTSYGEGDPLPGGMELLREASRRIEDHGEGVLNMAEDFHGGDEITQSLDEGGYGFVSQWEGGLHWNLRRAVVEENVDFPSLIGSLTGSFNGDPLQRVFYSESHDTTGHLNDNVRLPQEIDPDDPTGWLARKRSTLAAAVLMTAPGLPMLLMGQEFLQDGSFHDSHPLDWSNLEEQAGIVALYRDLIALRRDRDNTTAGLRGPNINVTHQNEGARVLIYHRWDRGGAGDDVMVVVNFGETSFPEYILGFPRAGSWQVRFDSDSSRYSPDFTDVSVAETTTEPSPRDGFDQSAAISIGPYSVVVLSQ